MKNLIKILSLILIFVSCTKTAKKETTNTDSFSIPYSSDTCELHIHKKDTITPPLTHTEYMSALVGNAPHNKTTNGLKQGIWIEIDSFSKYTTSTRINNYNKGKITGQALYYGTNNRAKLGISPTNILFKENDMESLLHLHKGENVVSYISDSIGVNTDFLQEAKELRFKGKGLQINGYSFDSYGNIKYINYYIYDFEGGDDYEIDSYLVKNIAFKHPEEEKIIKDIKFNIARGKLKKGGCQWTRMLVGDRLLHNYYINGEKHGIWVERDSNQIMISRYDHGKINGQRIVYHTPYIADIAFSPYEIGFFEGDRPKLAYVYVKHNIVRTVDKWFKDNESFTREADSLGFKNRGMQFYSAEFDSLGNKLGEGWRIFDYYGGKDFRTESHKIGEWIQ